MRIERALLLLLLVVGCGTGARGATLLDGKQAPDDVRAACDLTAYRCTRCHTIDRLLYARVETPAHWERYVERMRRMPQSGIPRSEVPTIVRCLSYHSFGPEGAR